MNTLQLKQPQELPEQKREESQPKSPYTTPMLERLGNVKQVTEGEPLARCPDDGGMSW